MSEPSFDDWQKLESLAERLSQSGTSPGSIDAAEWATIDTRLNEAIQSQDHASVLRLRLMFGPLLARDSATGSDVLRKLEAAAIRAADALQETKLLADFLGASGHNLHRLGYHRESIEAFMRAQTLYNGLGLHFDALKSYYMQSLCLRALGKRTEAITIIENVLDSQDAKGTWRGNPLQVRAWILQDNGDLAGAEASLREALILHEQTPGGELLMAGTLADLGEVVGLQRRSHEAKQEFQRSLAILSQYSGQYERLEARTKLKLAQLLIQEGDLTHALILIDEADDAIRSYGRYYDLLWRIELARSAVFFRQGRILNGLRKLRIVMAIRRDLRLPNSMLFRQLILRTWKRSGLPR